MKPSLKSGLLLLASGFCLLNSLHAHTDLHERIEAISATIEEDPDNPELLFNRGSLLEQHGDFVDAIADFSSVEQLAPQTEGLHFSKARCYYGLEEYLEALREIDRVGAGEFEGGRVHLWRGRILSRLDRSEEAAQNYRAAFARIEKASPDLYIEFARLISSAGREHYSEAIAGLDQAIETLGPVITLDLAALDLEEKLGDHEAALRRLDRMLKSHPGLAALLKRKGDVLQRLDRDDEAQQVYRRALTSLESLPPSRRNTDANRGLEREIRAKLPR